MKLLLISIFLILLVSASYSQAQMSEVRKILAQREATLAKLVAKSEQLERARCSRAQSFTNTVSSCSVPSCGNTFPSENNFTCHSDLGRDPETCGESCQGLTRSTSKSTILLAPQSSFSDPNIHSFLAVGEEYEQELRSIKSELKAWTGIGDSVSGVSRWFPGSPRQRTESSCSAYDPRLRSWYVAAASGSKDVIIVLDVSGSLLQRPSPSAPTRLELLKSATKSLLSTLSWTDYFAIVTFSSDSEILLGQTTLLQATTENIQRAQRAVDGLVAYGNTLFDKGFYRAFQVFQNSREQTSGCQRSIVFVTDGMAQDGDIVLNALQTYQTQLQNAAPGGNNKKAAIMTLSLGSGADNTLPQKIACANQGIWHAVPENTNPLNAMASYYKFLAFGIPNRTANVYVEPYIDAFGMGRMTTVSRSFYDATGVFAGVASVDIPLPELTRFVSEAALLQELNQRSTECPSYSGVSDCLLQLLRSEAGYECPGVISKNDCITSGQISEGASCSVGVNGGVNAMRNTKAVVQRKKNKAVRLAKVKKAVKKATTGKKGGKK